MQLYKSPEMTKFLGGECLTCHSLYDAADEVSYFKHAEETDHFMVYMAEFQ